MVRGKFRVNSIMDHGSDVKTLKLGCVYDSTIPEDKAFQKATPWGEISMDIGNPAALEQLQIGAYVYVDFTVIPKE